MCLNLYSSSFVSSSLDSLDSPYVYSMPERFSKILHWYLSINSSINYLLINPLICQSTKFNRTMAPMRTRTSLEQRVIPWHRVQKLGNFIIWIFSTFTATIGTLWKHLNDLNWPASLAQIILQTTSLVKTTRAPEAPTLHYLSIKRTHDFYDFEFLKAIILNILGKINKGLSHSYIQVIKSQNLMEFAL